MWLWDWHFYHPCLPIHRTILFWILKNLTLRVTLSLTLRDIWEKLQKLSVTEIYSVGFNHDADFDVLTNAKESSNLIGLENFWNIGFSITAGLEWCFLHQAKNDQIPTHQSLSPPNLYVIITWSWAL